MRGRAGLTVLLCGFVAAGVAFLAPAAEAGWLPPVDVSAPAEAAGAPHVVLDSEGNATAVWDRWNGADTVVEASHRPAGEGWEAPVDLSEPALGGEPLPGAHDAQSPRIAVDRNSNVTVVWERYAGSKTILQSVDLPAGGTWTTPVDIAEMSQGMDPEPWLAVDWEGNATVIWQQGGTIESAFRPFAGAWGEPVQLSEGENFVPQAAMDARGDATAVWMHFDGSHYVVESAYKPERGAWESPTLVSQPGEEGGDPYVALDAQGDSLVVWRGEDGGEEFVRAAYRPLGGSWGSPTDVSSEGEQVQQLRDAVDPDGNAIVAWAGDTGEIGGHEIAHAAYKPAGGEWEAPTALSADGGNAFPSDVVFDTSGNAAVIWERSTGSSNVVQAAYRPVGAAWEPAVDLSEEGKQGMDAVVVLDAPGDATAADGDATAVWVSAAPASCGGEKEGSCYAYTVQAAGYDPNGAPSLELEAPTTGTVGEPVEISTPTEGVFAPLIEFGDGTSVASTEASHVYEAPGEYEVTLGGAEVLGYRASTVRAITIQPVEGPPKPEGEPEPEAAGQGPTGPTGSGPSSSGASAGDFPATAVSGSAECAAAQSARDAALRRYKVARARLGRARDAGEARRLAKAQHQRAAALSRARQRAADACG